MHTGHATPAQPAGPGAPEQLQWQPQLEGPPPENPPRFSHFPARPPQHRRSATPQSLARLHAGLLRLGQEQPLSSPAAQQWQGCCRAAEAAGSKAADNADVHHEQRFRSRFFRPQTAISLKRLSVSCVVAKLTTQGQKSSWNMQRTKDIVLGLTFSMTPDIWQETLPTNVLQLGCGNSQNRIHSCCALTDLHRTMCNREATQHGA